LQRGLLVELGGRLEDEAKTHTLLTDLFLLLGRQVHTTEHSDAGRRGCWLRVGKKEGAVAAPKPQRPLSAEGYELRVRPQAIELAGHDLAGLFYGVATLRQLAAGQRSLPCVTIRDWPQLALRGIHYDLKGVMPTFDALMNSLVELSRFKLNCILLEYEDKFPWSKETGLASPLALTERELGRFLEAARARHVRVIPLIQSLGHVEMVLQHRRYAPLRETRDDYYQYCPSQPGAHRLLLRLIDEVAPWHADERLFHVGADEAWRLGTCPRCTRAVGRLGKNGLYLVHMEKVWKHLFSLGKQPVMWEDMLRHFSDRELSRVPRDVALMYWLYNRYEPDEAKYFPDLARYLKHGFSVIGASAAKGADGAFANLPNFERRLLNVFAWAVVARRHGLAGMVSTAWSRYTYVLPACEPFETMWPSLAGSAEAYWTGKPTLPEAFLSRFLAFTGAEPTAEAVTTLLRPDRRPGADRAKTYAALAQTTGRWADCWKLLAVLTELEGWKAWRESVESRLIHQLPALQTGRLPGAARRRLREKVARVLISGKALRLGLGRELRKALPRPEVEEFLSTRMDGYEAVLKGLGEMAR
jgi:hexosaminidase